MASSILGSSSTASKDEITQRSSNGTSHHDPTVICHEDEPFLLVRHRTVNHKCQKGKSLHDHKGIKVLDAIENRLDGVGPLGDFGRILPYEPRRSGDSLSKTFFFTLCFDVLIIAILVSKVSKRIGRWSS